MFNSKSNKPCKYFLQGHCMYGDKCNFSHVQQNQSNNMMQDDGQINLSHPPPQGKPNTTQNQNKNQCTYFLQGNCTKPNCGYFHGYGTNLQNVSFESAHSSKILNLVIINELRFITSDSNSFKIWALQPSFTCSQETKVEGNISKLIFSNDKIILAVQTNTMYVRY